MYAPALPKQHAPPNYPKLPRKRYDTAEISLGADASVCLAAPLSAPDAGRWHRIVAWSERVRSLIARGSVRTLAGLLLVGFAWICERGAS